MNIRNSIESVLKLEFKTPNDLRDLLFNVGNNKYKALALRNLFNFLEDYD